MCWDKYFHLLRCPKNFTYGFLVAVLVLWAIPQEHVPDDRETQVIHGAVLIQGSPSPRGQVQASSPESLAQ
jgi:hypothetical protein